MVQMPDLKQNASIVDLVCWQAEKYPERIALTFLPDGESQEVNLTFKQLDEKARRLAAWLQKKSRVGDRALILFTSSLDAFTAMYGCLYAGVIGVFTGMPRPNTPLDNLQATTKQARATLALTTTPFLESIKDRIEQSELKSIQWMVTDKIPDDISPDLWQNPQISPDNLSMLVYTSGSTGNPKGVMVSHRTWLTEMAIEGEGFSITPETVAISLAPHNHMAGIILPLLVAGSGMRCVLFPTQAFLERPIRWLKAISHYRANLVFVPGFCLQTCVDRTTPTEREGLDLRSLTAFVYAGERLLPDLMDQFTRAFEPYGFQRKAYRPSYVSTEGLFVTTGSTNQAGYQVYALDRDEIGNNRLVEVDPKKQQCLSYIGCGESDINKAVIIVDPYTLETCPTGKIGEIWVSSKKISDGYWDRPNETQETFQAFTADSHDGPYYRSGDLGGFVNGELVITGRIKDIIILHGKNFYAQDFEKTVEGSHPALKPAGVAAFPLHDENEERLAIACEIRPDFPDLDADWVISAVRQAIGKDQQQTVHLVALVKAGALRRSASGKLIRYASREDLLSGRMETIKISRLEESHGNRVEHAEGYVAPRTPIERALVGIWSGVLGKPQVGVNDDFFEIGGDSLKGSQILAQAQDVFLVEIPINLLFEASTVAGMAKLIVDLRNKSQQ